MNSTKVWLAVSFVLFLLLFTHQSWAQVFDYDDLQIEILVKEPTDPAVMDGAFHFAFNIPTGYELNAEETLLRIVPLTQSEGFSFAFGRLVRPEEDFVNELGKHYEGQKTLVLPYKILEKGESEKATLTFGFLLQACEQHGMCFPPTDPERFQRKVTLDISHAK